jgi:hypothetical protein
MESDNEEADISFEIDNLNEGKKGDTSSSEEDDFDEYASIDTAGAVRESGSAMKNAFKRE